MTEALHRTGRWLPVIPEEGYGQLLVPHPVTVVEWFDFLRLLILFTLLRTYFLPVRKHHNAATAKRQVYLQQDS